MDTGKEYIEMCEKAQEIQDIYEYKPWDLSDFTQTIYSKKLGGLTKIWLPRIDQLIEIITKGFTDPVNYIITMLHRFYCGMDKYKFKSMEQLVLIYMMFEKYNKQWNPKTKEWEKV